MTATRPLVLCALLLYLPAGFGQTPDAGTDPPAETQAAPAVAEAPDAGDTAGDVADTAGAGVTPPVEVTTPPPGDTAGPVTAPAATPATEPAAPVEDIAAPADTPAAPADAMPALAPAVTETADGSPDAAVAATDAPAAAPAAPGSPVDTSAPSPETTAATVTVPAAQVPATADFSTVRPYLVVVSDGMDANARRAPGFSISDQGHVLAYSGELRGRDSYFVTITGDQVFAAALLETDGDTGLMLLRIAEGGHGLGALEFARTALVAAAPLHAVKFDPAQAEPFSPVAGTVSRLPETDEDIPTIVHNALFNPAAAGTPLFNRCYQAVGVNVLQRTGFSTRPADPEQHGSAISLAAYSLNVLLASADLALPLADNECLSAEEENRLRLEQVRQEQEAALQAEREAAEARLRAAAEETQRREETLNMEREAAQQQIEQARQEKAAALQAERAAAEAEKRRLEEEAQQRLEQAQQEKEQALQAQQEEKEQALQAERQESELARQEARQATHTGKQILLLSLVVVLILLLVFYLVMRARRRRLQGVEQEKQQIAQALDRAQSDLSDASEREQVRARSPDVFIEGTTPQNERIALKIPGASLVEPAGATVGRSPAESAFIINHEQVSRRHFRLLLVSGQVMIEDLGSTNGTRVNGVPLSPGARQALGNGSRLETGHLAFTVRIGP